MPAWPLVEVCCIAWATSRRIRDAVWPLPLFLAGGLRADNVGRAIELVLPHGLDLCSSVRSAGTLDGVKLGVFFQAVQAATPDPGPLFVSEPREPR